MLSYFGIYLSKSKKYQYLNLLLVGPFLTLYRIENGNLYNIKVENAISVKCTEFAERKLPISFLGPNWRNKASHKLIIFVVAKNAKNGKTSEMLPFTWIFFSKLQHQFMSLQYIVVVITYRLFNNAIRFLKLKINCRTF